ncbi:hypothetical protein QQS21_006449 [Conoideocrella luteorostrata]|uniref:Cytochrome P450 n=1 Tax=Conoideocrella luteorostrata TaxID=1105319 RepID=A0AAJ0CQ99_9HYPO|nr:hypothetical protein QQS21_006449 [Conoideocrella luteorostrata]
MSSSIAIVVAIVATTYVFLWAIALLTHDPREPKAVAGTIPYVSTLIGMLTQEGRYYVLMRDKYRLPIYTLKVPGPSIYVVNSLSLVQRIDRHISTVAFTPIQARLCDKGMRVSKAGMAEIAGDKLLREDGYLRQFPRYAAVGASPGPGLDSLNRAAVDVFAASLDAIAAQGPTTIKLYDWIRHEIFIATTESTYGHGNPFRDVKNEQTWFEYEKGILTLLLGIFPSVFARRSLKACYVLVTELNRYLEEKKDRDASVFLKQRIKHNTDFGLSLADTAHTEVGQITAGIVNTAPCCFWLVWQIFSHPPILEDCRKEAAQLVRRSSDGVYTIDLAQVRTSCPTLLSTWQEVLRFHGTSVGTRIVQEDTIVDDQFLLKKGGVVLMPNAVIHSDEALWGSDAKVFNHKRFLKKFDKSGIGRPTTAFRGFGGGHVVCPGRYFVTTEVLSFLTLLLVRFDVRPIGGKWVEPSKKSAMDRACPLPKTDVEIELIPKSNQAWRVVFSEASKEVDVFAENIG